MARPRKNDAKAQGSLLTPDEAAEIPVEEQPYPLPEGWKWVRLGATITLHRGVSYRKNDAHSEPHPNDYLIMRGGNICEGEINLVADNVYVDKSLVSQNQIIRKLDIIIVTSTGSKKVIGRAGISFQDYSNVAFGAFLTLARVNEGFNKRYISMYFQTDIYRHRIRNLSNGININNVKSEYITKLKLPLPQLDEQQRIVDRIESLFAKLDEAKEKAEAVLDGFESRKAAILHKAFTGELTKNSESFSTWKEKTSQELFIYVTSGSRGWAKYYAEEGAVFIRMGNLDHGTIELDFSDIQYVRLPDRAEGQRSRLQKNDILISITADVGMVGFIKDDSFEGYINQHVALARPSTREDAEFIAWYLVSDVGLAQMRKKQRGATKVGLGLDDIRTLRLKMPSLNTQKKIVNILDRLLAREQQAKDAAETVLEQITLMKKAILAKAFRGELTGQVHN